MFLRSAVFDSWGLAWERESDCVQVWEKVCENEVCVCVLVCERVTSLQMTHFVKTHFPHFFLFFLLQFCFFCFSHWFFFSTFTFFIRQYYNTVISRQKLNEVNQFEIIIRGFQTNKSRKLCRHIIFGNYTLIHMNDFLLLMLWKFSSDYKTITSVI